MSNSPQFRRTDKAIMQALVSLLKRKSFDKITVQDILDETPVTRATFYAHYRDKYDIAEKMMDQFLKAREEVRKKLASSPRSISREVLYGSFTAFDREFTWALLKIHTDKVDFRRVMAGELEKEYLDTSNSPNRAVEAKIFAHAYVELYISMLNSEIINPSPEYAYSLFVPVAARLLNLDRDQETLDFLHIKVAKKLSGG